MNNSFLKLIRWPNLFIVAITQYFLQYLVLRSILGRFDIAPQLNHLNFFLFVTANMLIGASGYIINDIIDLPLDRINKPKKVVIESKISISTAWSYYFITLVVGFILYWVIAWQTGQYLLLAIYVAGVLGLWLYSEYLKKTPLLGNLFIGIYCAAAAFLILIVEWNAFTLLSEKYPRQADWIGIIFIGYCLFAFLSTVYREIIKDLEDMEGDRSENAQTLPLVIGPSKAKVIGFGFGLLLFGILLYPVYLSILNGYWSHLSFLFLGILAPLTHSFLLLPNARTKADFHKISQLLKWIMVAGLVYLIFI